VVNIGFGEEIIQEAEFSLRTLSGALGLHIDVLSDRSREKPLTNKIDGSNK